MSQVYMSNQPGIKAGGGDPSGIHSKTVTDNQQKMTIQGRPMSLARRPSEGNVQSYLVGRRFSLSRDNIQPSQGSTNGLYNTSMRTRSSSGDRSRISTHNMQQNGVGCHPMPTGFSPGRRYSIQTENPVSRQISQISGATLAGRSRRHVANTSVPMPVSIRSVPSSPVLQRKTWNMPNCSDYGDTYNPTQPDSGRVFPPVTNRGPQPFYPGYYSSQPQPYVQQSPSAYPSPFQVQGQAQSQGQPSVINVSGNVHISINGDQPVAMIGRSGQDNQSEFALWTVGHNGTNVPMIIKQMQDYKEGQIQQQQSNTNTPAYNQAGNNTPSYGFNQSGVMDQGRNGLTVATENDRPNQNEGQNMQYWNGGLLKMSNQINPNALHAGAPPQANGMTYNTNMPDSWPMRYECRDHVAGQMSVQDKLPDTTYTVHHGQVNPVYLEPKSETPSPKDKQENNRYPVGKVSVSAAQITGSRNANKGKLFRHRSLDSEHAANNNSLGNERPQVHDYGRKQRAEWLSGLKPSSPVVEEAPDIAKIDSGCESQASDLQEDLYKAAAVKGKIPRRRSVQDLVLGFEGFKRLVTYEEDHQNPAKNGVEIVELTDSEAGDLRKTENEEGNSQEDKNTKNAEKTCTSEVTVSQEECDQNQKQNTVDVATSECGTEICDASDEVKKQNSKGPKVSTSEGCAQTENAEDEEEETSENGQWILSDKGTETSDVCKLIPVISEMSLQEIQYDSNDVILVDSEANKEVDH